MEQTLLILYTLTLPFIMGSATIRLRDGPTPYSGRVEVYLDNRWGTVCHRQWGQTDASVACRQLGYPLGGKPIRNAAFGSEETLPILMASVLCDGSESSLSDCLFRSGTSCDHDEDAGVVCTTDAANDTTGQARLSDGNTNTSGRVEIQYNGVWGTVCRDGWNIKNSKVMCRDMGFCGGSSVMHEEGAFGRGAGPVWLTEVSCEGTEEHLSECPHDGWAENSCEHHSDVGVVCKYCPTGTIRLVGSDNNSSGIVTISNNGVWGTVCGESSWSDSEARVVCRSLGFADGLAADASHFTTASGPIWLSNVQCTGWENDLMDCDHDGDDGWGENDCRHYQDVAVNCTMTAIYTTKSSTSGVTHTTPSSTTSSSAQGAVSTNPPDVNSSKFIIIIVSVVVVAVVVIVVVVVIVCGVTKVKTTNAQHSILLTPRGATNEYMVSSDVNAEGACAVALVSVPRGKRESGVYQEIDEKRAANGRPCGRNTYTDEPGAGPNPEIRAAYRATPLPSIPGEDKPFTSHHNAPTDTDQDNYAEIHDNNENEYLTPLKLRC